jgi:transcriptional/translational regulatory protein YebC/TACO1
MTLSTGRVKHIQEDAVRARISAGGPMLLFCLTTPCPLQVDDESFERCEALVERLLELDDVDAVYSNCEGLHC